MLNCGDFQTLEELFLKNSLLIDPYNKKLAKCQADKKKIKFTVLAMK